MTNNADMPAMPVVDEAGMPFIDAPSHQCSIGLTKREHFAGMMMQPVLGNPYITERYADKPNEAAKMAVTFADALLSELDK